MPRYAATGTVVTKTLKSGDVSYSARFRTPRADRGTDREFVLLGYASEGMTAKTANERLADILAAVRLGTWKSPRQMRAEQDAAEAAAAAAVVPTFAEYAADWLKEREARKPKERTAEFLHWALDLHLSPFFGALRLDAIGIADVKRYVTGKLNDGDLNGTSINRTLSILRTVLDYAAEDYPQLPPNPAASRRRRAPRSDPNRIVLERVQVAALLDAARELDAEDRLRRPYRLAMLATFVYTGLRVGELIALRWRDVDLEHGVLKVRDSKTKTGVRKIRIRPELHPYLSAWGEVCGAAGSRFRHADLTPVFATSKGTLWNRNNIRRRVVVRAVERANERIAEDGGCEPLPMIAPHALRRTFASWLIWQRTDLSRVMAELGHKSAALTLEVYSQALSDGFEPSPEDEAAAESIAQGTGRRLAVVG